MKWILAFLFIVNSSLTVLAQRDIIIQNQTLNLITSNLGVFKDIYVIKVFLEGHSKNVYYKYINVKSDLFIINKFPQKNYINVSLLKTKENDSLELFNNSYEKKNINLGDLEIVIREPVKHSRYFYVQATVFCRDSGWIGWILMEYNKGILRNCYYQQAVE
ncbi:MAG: hypothetical protein JST82_13990 [Bacteroidetes bacterium]|nr:hypothetical protein [Bacteroidota bacterium]